MKKRVLSLVLALTVLFSLCVPVFAADDGSDAQLETADVTVEGKNDVGELIAKEIDARAIVQDPTADKITSLTVTNNTAVVGYQADRKADVVVAVYDERTGQMTASGNASISAGSGIVVFGLTGKIPDTFVASAFLLDHAGHEPLCEEYTTEFYTEDIQDLDDATVNDFAEERVLNLDGDPTTNFMVYSKDTVLVEPKGNVNSLTGSAGGRYTFANADGKLTGLIAGDILSYEKADGSLLLVKVASVSKEGNTVTVVEDDNAEITDFFDVVKIDVGSDENSEVAPAALVDTNANTRKSLEIEFEKKFDESLSVKVSGNIEVSIKVKIYISLSKEYIEFKATNKLEGKLTVEAEQKLQDTEQPLGKIVFNPLPGLSLGVEPKLVLGISGSFEGTVSVEQTFGYALDNGTFVNKSSDPKVKVKVTVEGKIEVGFKIEPYLALISEDLLKASAELGAVVEVKAKRAVLGSEEEHHDCEQCTDGDVNFKAYLKCSIAATKHVKYETLIFEVSLKLFDFYYSFDFDEFGLGTCPHNSYKVTLTVMDQSGAAVSGAAVGGTGLSEAPVTGADGKAVFFLHDGMYSLSASSPDGTVSGEPTMGLILLQAAPDASPRPSATPGPGTVPDIPPAGTPAPVPTPGGDIIASGDCGAQGDNVKWILTPNEDSPYYATYYTLTVYGEGDMADYEEDGSPWYSIVASSNVTRVVIQSGVTHIGAHAFVGFGVRSVVIPDSVTSIGPGAFLSCELLESVTIPESVRTIGEWAFYDTGLTNVTIPAGVVSIGAYAFSLCMDLEKVTIPDSVVFIGGNAFGACYSLKEVTIPSSVTSIDYVFTESGLTSVAIPDSVTSMYFAFAFWKK